MALPLSECDSFLNRVVMQAGAGLLGDGRRGRLPDFKPRRERGGGLAY